MVSGCHPEKVTCHNRPLVKYLWHRASFVDISMMNVRVLGQQPWKRDAPPEFRSKTKSFRRLEEFLGRADRWDPGSNVPEKRISVLREDLSKSCSGSQTLLPSAQLSPKLHLPLSLGPREELMSVWQPRPWAEGLPCAACKGSEPWEHGTVPAKSLSLLELDRDGCDSLSHTRRCKEVFKGWA